MADVRLIDSYEYKTLLRDIYKMLAEIRNEIEEMNRRANNERP